MKQTKKIRKHHTKTSSSSTIGAHQDVKTVKAVFIKYARLIIISLLAIIFYSVVTGKSVKIGFIEINRNLKGT